MNTNVQHQPDTAERVVLRASHRRQKHLGEWTTARHFAVDADASLVVVDLLLPCLAAGDINIDLDIDHSTLKLLVPDGAQIDDAGLRRIGRGGVKDRTGTSSPNGRRIVLNGEMRSSEVRVHRGGVALLSLLPSHLRDVRRAHKDGRLEPLAAGGARDEGS
jgi:hypothetical protein